jgi:4-amino-4-deoxy-L-arabinose transferase-like glycosyltransferase
VPRRRTLLWVALAVLAGGALRLAVAEWTHPVTPIGDERYYISVATNLALGRGHQVHADERALRPPAASYLLSWFIQLEHLRRPPDTAAFLLPLVRLQVVIGTALVAGTAGLAWVLFGGRAAAVAAVAAAADPELVTYSHHLWSENVFALLLVLALAALVAGARRGALPLALSAGAFLGLAALTREIGLAVVLVSAAWWVTAAAVPRSRALAGGAALLAAAALLVLPWTARNYQQFGRLVPLATNTWYSAGAGNVFEDPWWAPPGEREAEYNRSYRQSGDEMERMDFARRHTLVAIQEHQPTWLLKKLVRNGSQLLGPDSFLFYKFRQRAYGDVSQATIRLLVVVSALFYAFVFAGAVLGLAGTPRRREAALSLAILAVWLAVHLYAIANSRHRMPFEPLLLVWASHAAAHWRALSWTPGRRAAAILALAVFFGVFCPWATLYSHASFAWRLGG